MDIIRFFREAQKLKHIKRTGWVNYKVPNPESVADHCFGVILLSAVVPLPEGIDRDELIKMAIVHDICESITGDVVEEVGTKHLDTKDAKIKRELEATAKVMGFVDDEELTRLAIESVEMKTPLAKFLKQVDRLEMALQAREYEEEGTRLNDHWANSDMHITDSGLRKYFDELDKHRK